jgi:uncharacterized Zn finger protein (UPF0148 family)
MEHCMRDGEPTFEPDLTLTDRVCPKCSSSLKFDRRNGWVYCSSSTCNYFEPGFVPASQIDVTGRDQTEAEQVGPRSAPRARPAINGDE